MITQQPQKKKATTSDRVVLRNLAVYGLYRKLLMVTIFSFVVAILSFLVALYSKGKSLPPQYIPISHTGEIIKPIPLNLPNQSDAEIQDFAMKSIRALHTYDYKNWKTQFQNAAPYFTPQGWEKYLNELSATGTLKVVDEKRSIVSVDIAGDVKILAKGVGQDGLYTWKIELPIKIGYQYHTSSKEAQSEGNSSSYKAVVTIVRVPTLSNARGVAIQTYTASL